MKIKGEDIEDVNLALGLGYRIYWEAFNGLHFIHPQKNRSIWKCVIEEWDEIGWQTADCVADVYENHRPFKTLRVALERELTRE